MTAPEPDALERAAQAVISAAVRVTTQTAEEYNNVMIVWLGPFQDLQMAIDAWRAAGGKTVEEQA